MTTALQRTLLIFNRLRQSPASKEALQTLLRQAGAKELEPKAEERRFERDLDKLRNQLGATVVYDGATQKYVLLEAGELLEVRLSAESLQALAFLHETTDENDETRAIIQPLLDTLTRLMSADQLRQLETASAELRVDLRQLDDGEISPTVWEKVRFARDKKRCVRFFYQSPHAEGGVLHIVEPHELRFERGHFYLHGFCLEARDAEGQLPAQKWIRYRLDRIAADGNEIERKSIKQRSKPRIPIKFKLAPQLWRSGLSRRFEGMEILEVDEEGWAVISAETDDLFYARRVLLGYGALALALAPPKFVDGILEAHRTALDRYRSLYRRFLAS